MIQDYTDSHFKVDDGTSKITITIEDLELREQNGNTYVYNVYRTVNGNGDIHHDYQLVTIIKENGTYVIGSYELNDEYDYTNW